MTISKILTAYIIINVGHGQNSSKQECGILGSESNRVWNGDPETTKEIPWMVGVLRTYENENEMSKYSICSGTLITDWTVLSDVTCASGIRSSKSPSDLKVVSTLKAGVKPGHSDQFEVSHFFRERGSKSGRIMMIVLKERWSTHHYFMPICLPTKPIPFGIESIFLGFGGDQKADLHSGLRANRLYILNFDECKHLYSKINQPYFTTGYICAIGRYDNNFGRCEGDSGGPLIFLDSDDRYYQAGTSLVYPTLDDCKTGSLPLVFYDTFHFLMWIEGHLRLVHATTTVRPPSKPTSTTTTTKRTSTTMITTTTTTITSRTTAITSRTTTTSGTAITSTKSTLKTTAMSSSSLTSTATIGASSTTTTPSTSSGESNQTTPSSPSSPPNDSASAIYSLACLLVCHFLLFL